MSLIGAATDAAPSGTPYERNTVTSAELLVIPSALRGKFVRFSAETSDVFIRFGTSDSVTVAASAVSTEDGSGNLTGAATTPHLHLPAGQSEQFRLRADWTHLAHISADTSGKLRLCLWQGAFGAEG